MEACQRTATYPGAEIKSQLTFSQILLAFFPETKGKTLEEMDNLFRKGPSRMNTEDRAIIMQDPYEKKGFSEDVSEK